MSIALHSDARPVFTPDASGQVLAPASQAAVPDVPVPDIHGETNGIHYDITSVVLHTTFDEPVTGAIDPFTGAAALHAQLHFRVSFTAQASLASCPRLWRGDVDARGRRLHGGRSHRRSVTSDRAGLHHRDEQRRDG